ncbi:MAG: hypothetical protein PHE20_03250 [Patescibacteria group bacterium]|jgi:hypothetical protein|nr:hypothetical protein [Patescibacteria group bacterium]
MEALTIKTTEDREFNNFNYDNAVQSKHIFIDNKKFFKRINNQKLSSVTSGQIKNIESSVYMMNSVFAKGWVDKAEFITKDEFFKRFNQQK